MACGAAFFNTSQLPAILFLFSSHLSTLSFKNTRNTSAKYISYSVRQEDVSPIFSLSTSEPKEKKAVLFSKTYSCNVKLLADLLL